MNEVCTKASPRQRRCSVSILLIILTFNQNVLFFSNSIYKVSSQTPHHSIFWWICYLSKANIKVSITIYVCWKILSLQVKQLGKTMSHVKMALILLISSWIMGTPFFKCGYHAAPHPDLNTPVFTYAAVKIGLNISSSCIIW